MAPLRARIDQATDRIAFAFWPLQIRWQGLEARPRRLILSGSAFLVAGLILAFVWHPAVRMRDALTVRLPQLQSQLATMRSQASQLAALTKDPVPPMVMRRAADMAALQSIFGSDTRIVATQDGFQIVIPSISYANWWDKTSEAVSRHALVLKEASLVRADGPTASIVAVDMRLGFDAGQAGPTSPAGPAGSATPAATSAPLK